MSRSKYCAKRGIPVTLMCNAVTLGRGDQAPSIYLSMPPASWGQFAIDVVESELQVSHEECLYMHRFHHIGRQCM